MPAAWPSSAFPNVACNHVPACACAACAAAAKAAAFKGPAGWPCESASNCASGTCQPAKVVAAAGPRGFCGCSSAAPCSSRMFCASGGTCVVKGYQLAKCSAAHECLSGVCAEPSVCREGGGLCAGRRGCAIAVKGAHHSSPQSYCHFACTHKPLKVVHTPRPPHTHTTTHAGGCKSGMCTCGNDGHCAPDSCEGPWVGMGAA